jgi:hypothetical protein
MHMIAPLLLLLLTLTSAAAEPMPVPKPPGQQCEDSRALAAAGDRDNGRSPRLRCISRGGLGGTVARSFPSCLASFQRLPLHY